MHFLVLNCRHHPFPLLEPKGSDCHRAQHPLALQWCRACCHGSSQPCTWHVPALLQHPLGMLSVPMPNAAVHLSCCCCHVDHKKKKNNQTNQNPGLIKMLKPRVSRAVLLFSARHVLSVMMTLTFNFIISPWVREFARAYSLWVQHLPLQMWFVFKSSSKSNSVSHHSCLCAFTGLLIWKPNICKCKTSQLSLGKALHISWSPLLCAD